MQEFIRFIRGKWTATQLEDDEDDDDVYSAGVESFFFWNWNCRFARSFCFTLWMTYVILLILFYSFTYALWMTYVILLIYLFYSFIYA